MVLTCVDQLHATYSHEYTTRKSHILTLMAVPRARLPPEVAEVIQGSQHDNCPDLSVTLCHETPVLICSPIERYFGYRIAEMIL